MAAVLKACGNVPTGVGAESRARNALLTPVQSDSALCRPVAVDFSACPDSALLYCVVQRFFADPTTVPDLTQEPCHCIDEGAMDMAFQNPPKLGE